jgi:hypothetical protein
MVDSPQEFCEDDGLAAPLHHGGLGLIVQASRLAAAENPAYFARIGWLNSAQLLLSAAAAAGFVLKWKILWSIL